MNAVVQPTEAEIQHACIQFLNSLHGVVVWRANTGAMVLGEGYKRRFVRFGTRGQSDLLGIASVSRGQQGRLIAVEVKRPKKQPTPEQQAWLAMILNHGGIAFVAHSIDECMEQAKAWGLT